MLTGKITRFCVYLGLLYLNSGMNRAVELVTWPVVGLWQKAYIRQSDSGKSVLIMHKGGR